MFFYVLSYTGYPGPSPRVAESLVVFNMHIIPVLVYDTGIIKILHTHSEDSKPSLINFGIVGSIIYTLLGAVKNIYILKK